MRPTTFVSATSTSLYTITASYSGHSEKREQKLSSILKALPPTNIDLVQEKRIFTWKDLLDLEKKNLLCRLRNFEWLNVNVIVQ